MDTRQNDEMELDLREVFSLLMKYKKTILLVTIFATIITWTISFFIMTPVYEASTEILVNKAETEQGIAYDINDINTDLKLISTYSVIIKSPRITDLVIEKYDLNLTSEELVQKISINTVRDSQVMKITVTDKDQHEAARIANGIAAIFQMEIDKIMNVDNVQILTKAKKSDNPTPVKPNVLLNTAIAFVIGLMASVGYVFIRERLDNTIKTEEEILQLLGYPVIGTIPTIVIEEEDKKTLARMTLKQRGESIEG